MEWFTHGTTPIGFCDLCQLVLCGGTPQQNSARTLAVGGKTRIFCSEPCQVLFTREPERYAAHETVVGRILAGEAPANLLELLRVYFGLTQDGWGKDVAGKPWIADLGRMPHMLVAGATGSGKTVCLNTIILSLLFQNGPDDLKLMLIDPKRVELPVYNGIPHLLTPAITEVPKIINALKWAITEMDRRFTLLSQAGKRDIGSYNEVADEKIRVVESQGHGGVLPGRTTGRCRRRPARWPECW